MPFSRHSWSQTILGFQFSLPLNSLLEPLNFRGRPLAPPELGSHEYFTFLIDLSRAEADNIKICAQRGNI